MSADKTAEPWLAPTIAEYEKLGAFYLGRPYDLAAGEPEPGLLLYDSRDLVTHAVCVGMTGSGKTGLCVGLIEEAALDGVPTIAIDPKGDLGNLLLTFPQLRPEDFRPWINEGDAERKQMTPDEFAAGQSELWRKGLAGWGQDGERIKRLREAADFTIFTPGSTAGRPVSILASFAAPPPAMLADRELLLERVSFTATSILGLLGIDADPVRSREHILVSSILHAAWAAGEDLDLASLIRRIQDPPMKKVGVVDMESFFPGKDRHDLAMALNNLLAAPAFATWLEGEPLDIGKLLYDEDGKARVSIFSIAHLSDAERMFFVSLLLSQMVSWVRGQSGTTSLRALLYMDEIFGYFPPVAEPPSKRPLLTLLKQARAYGLGVVLATQNPADLDYKGLSNTGTWFLGRLQTERDKMRVIEGLEGAAARDGGFDKAELEEMLAGLGSRVFLMHNVHEDEPVVFQTRWALSYLRGPLTRNQVRTLMADKKAPEPEEEDGDAVDVADDAEPAASAEATRPVLPPGIDEYFVPVAAAAKSDPIRYRPMLFGSAEVRFTDRKLDIDIWHDRGYLAPIGSGAAAVDWDRAHEIAVPLAELGHEPEPEAEFAALPAAAAKASSYKRWASRFGTWLYRNTVLEAGQLTREQREAVVESIRERYRSKVEKVTDKVERTRRAVERDVDQKRAEELDTIISMGTEMLGSLFGRRSRSRRSTSRSRSRTARNRSAKLRHDFEDAVQELEALRREVEAEINDLDFSIKPSKSNIDVRKVVLVWAPFVATDEGVSPAWRQSERP